MTKGKGTEAAGFSGFSYSTFFASGFHVIANRTRRINRHTTDSSSLIHPYALTEGPSTTRSSGHFNSPTTRKRPTSMVIPSVSRPDVAVIPSSRHRRSSVISFPSRLLERMRPSSAARSGDVTRRQSSATTDIAEFWLTNSGSLMGPSDSEDVTLRQTIDPFSASPDSKSFFIELTDSSPSPVPKSESFLSLSSSSTRSLVLRPSHRERPVSVQTMPLPPRSRHSSTYRPPSREKYDPAWTLEEASPVHSQATFEEEEEWRDPKDDDWRQFHIDLLRGDAQIYA